MNALEAREKKNLNTASKNTTLHVNQPPKELFKVVVNNYRQKEKPTEKENQEIVETMNMPPQPGGYIKYPKHDWL